MSYERVLAFLKKSQTTIMVIGVYTKMGVGTPSQKYNLMYLIKTKREVYIDNTTTDGVNGKRNLHF